MAVLNLPFLTEMDTAEKSEGGLDPLGLEAIADALGTRLVPGVRERQTHPRYLTTIAVGLAVCEAFDSGRVATDGVSDPRRVFEWYVVQGLVLRSTGRPVGVPGSLKAAKAIDDRVPLSAARYLKTPSVFGFHGIYRLLARTLGVESGERLGEFGYELLNVWSREQGLAGFYGSREGPGTQQRHKLVRAVEDGLLKSATDRSNLWEGWDFFSKHLTPLQPGPEEAALIRRALLQDSKGFRTQVISFLASPAGKQIWDQPEKSEREFHRGLLQTSSGELRDLLETISLYEQFCRLCLDAFDDCLFELTRRSSKTAPASLATLTSIEKACREAPELFLILQDRLAQFGQAGRFCESFQDFVLRGTPLEWVELLISHHFENQKRKPPDGKLPWFERFDNGDLIIRPLYRRDRPGRADASYVHAYRTGSLWSFARDLGAIE